VSRRVHDLVDEDLDGDDEGGPSRRLRRAGRLLGFVGGGAAVLGVLAVGVFPTRIFLDQRASSAEAQERLDVLRDQNEAYEERIERLGTDEEIERLAREQYNLVFPGEEPYSVLPAPLPPLELPPIWPFGPLLPASGVTDAATEALDTQPTPP